MPFLSKWYFWFFCQITQNRIMIDGAMMSVNYFKWGICLLLFLAICFGTSGNVHGWSNGGYSSDESNPDYGTHDWIADAALQLQTRDVAFLKTTFHNQYLLGTEAPDNPDFIGDTGSHHVYYRANGTLQDDACAERARAIYESALQYLKAKDFEHASFEMGAMVHYISDVGVFGHTMGSTTDWGSETHHSDYEDYMNSVASSMSFPTSILLGNKDAYNATLDLARDITFGNGTLPGIWSNVKMDNNYNWNNKSFHASASSSLNESAMTVASAINHILIESGLPAQSLPPQADNSSIIIILGGVIAGGSAVAITIHWRRKR
jgi:hypothetical protein